MGCEGPNGYDPAAEIAARVGAELPKDFHCEAGNNAGGNNDQMSEYEEMNDMTRREENRLYRESMGREELRIAEEEAKIAKEGLDKM